MVQYDCDSFSVPALKLVIFFIVSSKRVFKKFEVFKHPYNTLYSYSLPFTISIPLPLCLALLFFPTSPLTTNMSLVIFSACIVHVTIATVSS